MTSQITILSQAYPLFEHLEKFFYYLVALLPLALGALLFLGFGLWWAKRLWFGLYTESRDSADASLSIFNQYSDTVDDHAHLLESLTTDFHDSQNKIATRDKSIVALNAQVTKFETDRNGFRQDLNDRDAELAALQKRFNKLEAVVTERDSEIEELKQTILSDNKDAEQQKKKLTRDLQNKDGEIEAKSLRIAELEDDLKDRKGAIAGLELLNLELGETKESETLQLTTSLSDKDAELKTSAKRIGKLETQIADLKGQKEELELNFLELGETKESETLQLTTSLSDKDAELKTSAKRIGKLETQIADLKGQKEGLELNFLELGEIKERDTLQFTTSLADKDAELVTRTTRISKLENQIADLKEQNEGLELNFLELGEIKERDTLQFTTSLADKDAELETSTTRIGELESQIGDLKEQNEGLELTNLELGEANGIELEAHACRIENLQETIENQGVKITDLESINLSASNQVEALKGTLKDRDSAIETFELANLELEEAKAKSLAELQATINNQETKITELETHNASTLDKVNALENQLNDRNSAFEALELLNLELDEAKTLEAENLNATLLGKDGELDALRNRTAELQEVIKNRDNKLETLGAENLDQSNQLEEWQALVTEKEEELEGIKGIHVELNKRITDRSNHLNSLSDEKAELEKLLADRGKQIATLNKDIKVKDQLDKRLKEREIEISQLTADKEKMNVLLGDSENELTQLNIFLENKDIEIEQLLEQAQEKDALANLLTEMEGALQTKDTEIAGKDNQLSSLFEQAEAADNKLSKALVELQMSETELQKIEADFALAFTPLGAFRDEDNITEDSERGILFTQRPDSIDDLKLISGIAEVLEGKLHDIGVYRFKQIALWKQDQIDVFSEQLSFKDRIENDLWVNQAADLHRRKYAENLAPQVDIYARKVIKPKPAPTTLIEKMFKGENVVENDKLGVIYTQPPAEIDDLKAIKGVAGVLEQRLNEHGVYQYRQIATWTPVHIEEFGEQLSFKDRIERDLWVHQAIDLHQEKYGEFLKPRSKLYNEVVLTPKKAAKKVEVEVETIAEPDPTPTTAAFEETTVVEDKQFGLVFTERPEEIDDLKEIKGVGKVLEEALHEFGVYRFKQIALWSETVVQEFVANLPFGDRVTRDLWINQASTLHQSKYQEPIAF